ncbi:MAG: radical SAM protein, partial [Aliifodinibius sp.]|nr:radical SAM protein [Phycisphaerae bacterium]NIT61757.1 radical SAM protein [Fodinibius sp.]NIV10432.1 radical SAM protein [Fodinibius sp.]NIY30337.1 radical SAM protein [Fodinibius sp.]
GITCNFTAYSDDTLEVAANVKSLLPNVPVVLGGAHATMAARTILEENSCIDYIVR